MSEQRVPIRVTFDAEADAAYIYLVDPIAPGEAAKTYPCDLGELGGTINLDFDTHGRLLGIEVLDAQQVLDPRLLNRRSHH